MDRVQPGILAALPPRSRHLWFALAADAQPTGIRDCLAALAVDDGLVVGIGAPIRDRLGLTIDDLRTFPSLSATGIAVPSTQDALWCWLRGDDQGVLLLRGRALAAKLAPTFVLRSAIDGFVHRGGRDLSGYEDGTENPVGEAAIAAAIVQHAGPDLDGGSFVATQIWQHDLDRFDGMTPLERDHIIGRRILDNEEIADAPASAHVKRTAQESFSPHAFVVRRSVPWAEGQRHGLVFVAFGRDATAFEAILRRMLGAEDGIADGIFRFTRPLTGGYYYCPPCVRDGQLLFGSGP